MSPLIELPTHYAVDLTPVHRTAMAKALLSWLEGARKNQVRDLVTRIAEMQANIAHLVERLQVRVLIRPLDAGYKVEPAEVDLPTWLALSRGTAWLESCDSLEARLLAVLA